MAKLAYGISKPKTTETDVLICVLSDTFSKDTITFENGGSDAEVPVGTVLGEVKYDAVAEPACVGTGDGTLTAISLGENAKVGDYIIRCTTGGASAVFSVTGPDGYLIGIEIGHNADFISQHLDFTLTAGATPFAKGDTFTVTIASPSSKIFKVVDDAATDGTQVASAVLLRHHILSADEQVSTRALTSNGHVKSENLVFPDTFDQAAKDLATTQLAAVGIVSF